MKKFNSFRNRQNGFEDLGSGTAEAASSEGYPIWECTRDDRQMERETLSFY